MIWTFSTMVVILYGFDDADDENDYGNEENDDSDGKYRECWE